MAIKTILILISLSVVLGCGGYDRAVLLPDSRGGSGALSVTSATAETTLEQPYRAADVYRDGTLETKTLDAGEVQRQFGQALAAQPPRPVSYTLYFIVDRNELTPESKPIMERIKNELAGRPFPEISVIGHTDSMGADAYNDALSLKRAEAMRQILIEAGIPSQLISVAGRGSREMVIKTPEGVAEPRNRRVEISVR